MNVLVEDFTAPFSQWALRVLAVSYILPEELYAESAGNNHPFCATACIGSSWRLLEALDRHHLGKEVCKKLIGDGSFKVLGEGTSANWKDISIGLVQRAGTHIHHPAWLETDPEQCKANVRERLQRACCSGEVAVLMLHLAVRTACLHSSWYGPWDSVEALQQLVKADAWSSLVHALNAMLINFGANLACQYNAINIASDVLHVSRPLVLPVPQLSLVVQTAASSCCDKQGVLHASPDFL